MKPTLILALALIPGAAAAASFDCAKASSRIEQLICSDARLGTLDEQLAAAYAKARSGAPNRPDIVEAQKRWLKNERADCTDAACLATAYSRRIAALQEWATTPGPALSAGQPNEPAEPLPKALRDAGIRQSMRYDEAKRLLLAAGWRIEPPNGEPPIYRQHPEISCGEGWQAVCSVGLTQGPASHGLVVKEIRKALVVDSAY